MAACATPARRCCPSTANTTRCSSACRAIARCGEAPPGVKRILLTASGGPFLDADRARLDACHARRGLRASELGHGPQDLGRLRHAHEQGPGVHRGLPAVRRDARSRSKCVIHRESIVHSLVEYVDGSVLAQLGAPDMRTPIAHALAWPERVTSGVQSLDLIKVGTPAVRGPRPATIPGTGPRAGGRSGGRLAARHHLMPPMRCAVVGVSRRWIELCANSGSH